MSFMDIGRRKKDLFLLTTYLKRKRGFFFIIKTFNTQKN